MNNSGWPSTVKPSQTVSAKDEKKPQRRTPWACDECRLRKRKCDGVEPCSPCQRSGLDCSYHFRRPAPPQTQRIQMLEVHLRYVRSFLRDASRKVSPELRADFESVLQKISSVAPEAFSPPNGTENSYAMSADDSASSVYHGDASARTAGKHHGMSQQSFLQQVLQLTSSNPHSVSDPAALTELFDLPLPNKQHLSPAPLPSQRKAMLLIDALFDSHLPILAFLHERFFRDMVDMVYSKPTPDDGLKAFLPLLHFALALGRLFLQPHDPQHSSCEQSRTEALQHYLAGRALLPPLSSIASNLTSLQTLLLAAIFLVTTSRVAAAHPLVGLACSLALRLGLHATNASLPAEEQLFRARACAAVMHVDLLGGVVLGTPPFLRVGEVEVEVLERLAREAERVGDWGSVVLVAGLKLLCVCRVNEDAVGVAWGEGVEERQAAVKLAGQRLKGWREFVDGLLGNLRGQEGGAELRYELDMLYNFGFLMLWRPLLLDLLAKAKSNQIARISTDDVHFATACVNLAETCRAHTGELLEETRLNVFSWTAVYTSFLAEAYVIALLSLEGLAPRLDGHTMEGIHLLAASQCGDACATGALIALKTLCRDYPAGTLRLRIEEVDSETRQFCESKRSEDDANGISNQRSDDILNLLNTRSHEAAASSASSVSRSPSLL